MGLFVLSWGFTGGDGVFGLIWGIWGCFWGEFGYFEQFCAGSSIWGSLGRFGAALGSFGAFKTVWGHVDL